MPFKLRSFINQDLDQVFSYNTNIILKVHDVPLGICFRLFQLLIFIYIFIVAVLYAEAYYEVELSQGISVIQTTGLGNTEINADSNGIWDALDVTSVLNGNTLFVATELHFKQSRGICTDFHSKCDSTKVNQCDANLNESCDNGKCKGPNWCSPAGNSSVVHYELANKYIIWIKGAVRYDRVFEGKIFSNLNDQVVLNSDDPNNYQNAFSITQLLQMNKPYPLTMLGIKDTGAIIQVNVNWICGGYSTCHPSMDVHRVDSFSEFDTVGAYQTKTRYYRENGVVYRDLFNMTGVRFIFNTKGKAMRISPSNIILQIATFLTLVRFATLIFDAYILHFPSYKENLKKEKYVELDTMAKSFHEDESKSRRKGYGELERLSGEEDGLMAKQHYTNESLDDVIVHDNDEDERSDGSEDL